MILFIAAEIREFIGLRRHLRNQRRLSLKSQWAMSGELNSNDVILATNGPGPYLAGQAVQAVEESQRLNALVSYGFCGALDPALDVNDMVVASEVECKAGVIGCDVPKRQAAMPSPQRVLSIDRVVGTSAEKAEFRAKSSAVAIEMEASALILQARLRSIPFYCVRVITDSAAEDFPIDFNGVRDAEGRFSRYKIVAQAVRDPFRLIPALIHLNQRANAAAQQLGDFVASCEFRA